MLFNGRTLIFTFSRTQVRIAEIERLQSLFKTSMSPTNIVHDNDVVCKFRDDESISDVFFGDCGSKSARKLIKLCFHQNIVQHYKIK